MDKIKHSILSLKLYQIQKKHHLKCKDWLLNFQCPLIIEEHEDGVKSTPYFYQFSGLQGGLHEDRRKYLKRVHIIIQGSVGIYLAKNLHMNTHYQIKMNDLHEFLTILTNKEYRILLTPQSDIKNKTVLIHLPTESLILSESAVMTFSEEYIKRNLNNEFKELNFIKSYKCIMKHSNKSAKDRNSIRFDMSFSGRNSTYENIKLFEKEVFLLLG